MIPLRDTSRSKGTPFLNYGLIIVCGVAFLYELSLGERLDGFLYRYGLIPAQLSSTLSHGSFSLAPVGSIFTSMFLHAGWIHLIGNMLFLYVFGANVEARLGHRGYFGFYLACGATAALVQVAFSPHSQVPMVGASGAIAGVLGAYFILFPKAKILTMAPLFVFFPVVEISAFFFLGFWFVLQFAQAYLSGRLGVAGGGIAWWAHAGGFASGAAFLPLFLLLRKGRRSA
jgi:membrane associated rhomboid family serine protease